MSRFVIVVDTQTDFMAADGALSVAGADTLIEPMRQWLAALPPQGTAGVLFTYDTHRADTYGGSAEAEQFPIHCVHGTTGWSNVLDPALIDPAIPVYRLEKGVFDMWSEPRLLVESVATGEKTERDAFFARLTAKGVTDVAVIGVAADYCVRWAMAGLVDRGFAVTVPAWLTRGISRPIEQVVRDEFGEAGIRLEAAA